MATAQYTFLPWLRRGIAGRAQGADEKGRLTAALQLQVRGEGLSGEVAAVVDQTVRLFGPGDITGIDRRAVVRTVPRAGVRDFEANFLPAIEFYEEDFPWRYTAAPPSGGKLSPWLWLTVLADGEFTRKGMMGPLPAIEISAEGQRGAFPPPATAWAWAHTQLNFALPADAEPRKYVEDELNKNPNLACSRLLCPRRLQPGARYTAFLIPAFEKGRLAGLGYDEPAVDAVPNSAPSWLPEAQVNGPRLFPVYLEWEFSTSSAGDFEQLAALLQPLEPEAAQALAQSNRKLDIRQPGWGLRYTGAGGTVAMESALQTPSAGSTPITDSPEPEDKIFVETLANLINLGVAPPTGGAEAEDDPFVVPPLYGSFYKPGVRLDANNPESWTDQLNLNPVYRVAAGQGTSVVQQFQEEYMDRAWDQLGSFLDARTADRRWEWSLQTSRALFSRRFTQLLETESPTVQFRAFALTAPLHGILRGEESRPAGGGARGVSRSVAPSLGRSLGSRYAGAYSVAFSRITRSNGPLMRRFGNSPADTREELFFKWKPSGRPTPNYLEETVKGALEILTAGAFGSTSTQLFLKGRVEDAGFVSIANCKQVLEALLPFLKATAPAEDPDAPERFGRLHRGMKGQLEAEKNVRARRNVLGTPPQGPATFTVPDPMYRALAERSTDFILPGLDRIKPNRVVLLKPNPAFIEAYLVGLNHEMAREFLWREYPAALDGTFFRQFWDLRDNPHAYDATSDTSDIKPILNWKNPLGENQAGRDTLVVAIRGDLLRKYPETEVYLQEAEWVDWIGEDNIKHKGRQPKSGANAIRPALFSARLEPDYVFLGFDVSAEAAVGKDGSAGWFFALKERAGNVHFGLDLDESTADPSWPDLGEVQENQCIDVQSEAFRNLPRYRGERADGMALMLFQKPYLRYVHAGRLVAPID